MTISVRDNVSLRNYTTMAVGGSAKHLVEVASEAELREAIQWASVQGVEFMILGGGSNTIFTDDGYDGLIIINKCQGIEFNELQFTAAGGVDWDELVAATVERGLSGIECLSGIPGRA